VGWHLQVAAATVSYGVTLAFGKWSILNSLRDFQSIAINFVTCSWPNSHVVARDPGSARPGWPPNIPLPERSASAWRPPTASSTAARPDGETSPTPS